MKLLYVTIPAYFDLEISLIRELSKICEVKVILFISNKSLKSSAFSLNEIEEQCDLISAHEYNGMRKYREFINCTDWFIANNPNNSIRNAFKLTKKINQFIKIFKPDLIHYTSFNFNIVGTTIINRNKFRSLLTIHDPESHDKMSIKNKLLKLLTIRSCKNIMFLSCVSDYLQKKYLKNCKNIYYSRLGPYDFLNKYVNASYGEMLPKKYLLFFGRIEKYKGVDLLINCFYKTKAYKEGYHLIIAGKGEILLSKSYEADNIHIFNRYIENEELANLIYNSRFIILPYLSATQSGVIMSAFALNKPVLATNVGNFNQILGNGKYGKIIEPNNEVELINGINDMISSDQDLSRVSQRIHSDFNGNGLNGWSVIANDLIKTYKMIQL